MTIFRGQSDYSPNQTGLDALTALVFSFNVL